MAQRRQILRMPMILQIFGGEYIVNQILVELSHPTNECNYLSDCWKETKSSIYQNTQSKCGFVPIDFDIPVELLLTNNNTIVPCLFASDADFKTDATAANALENNANPVPRNAPSHSHELMKFGSLFMRARTSMSLGRPPKPLSKICFPENSPKWMVPVAFGFCSLFAWLMIQWSVVKLATSNPTMIQFPKNVAKTRPRLRMPILIVCTRDIQRLKEFLATKLRQIKWLKRWNIWNTQNHNTIALYCLMSPRPENWTDYYSFIKHLNHSLLTIFRFTYRKMKSPSRFPAKYSNFGKKFMIFFEFFLQ